MAVVVMGHPPYVFFAFRYHRLWMAREAAAFLSHKEHRHPQPFIM